MKRLFIGFLTLGLLGSSAVFATGGSDEPLGGQEVRVSTTPESAGKEEKGVILLDKAAFIDQVFDFENNAQWAYKGQKPAIIDFYADWCGPCKMLSPVLAELQEDYNGNLQVYKVDTDRSKELAAAFGIRSLPTIVFVPLSGEPRAVLGFVPKEELEKMIQEHLKISK
jgi:thioredoxin